MKDNNLSKLSLPEFKISFPEMNNVTNVDFEGFSKQMARQRQIELDKETAQVSREEKQIELLEEIRNNTGSLVNMVDMIYSNSDQQTEILLIIADILAIGTATTPEEVESLYKKTMDKINHTIESGENIAKLTTWATTTWNLMKNLPL